jgi:hypothetical protein
MKKLIVLIAVVLVASMAFAQLSYVGAGYKGANIDRIDADKKLGGHDVMASSTFGAAQTAQRNGCQSCHVPHGGNSAGISDGFLWAYGLPANILGNFDTEAGVALVASDRTFHTLACMSCHDGATATNAVSNNAALSTWAKLGTDLKHDHPVDAQYTHGNPKAQYVRMYDASGASITVTRDPVTGAATNTLNGYIECASCHDPHAGDDFTYDFLRGPGTKSVTFNADGSVASSVFNTYTQVSKDGISTVTYTGTSPQWARLGICRDCHGK